MELLNNTNTGLVLAIALILQYAMVIGYTISGGFKKKPINFFLNLIPFWWALLLTKAVGEAFYETVILNRNKH